MIYVEGLETRAGAEGAGHRDKVWRRRVRAGHESV